MCASCGCGSLNDDHGDNRNITLAQLRRAAEAADIPVSEVGENIADATSQAEEEPAPEAEERNG